MPRLLCAAVALLVFGAIALASALSAAPLCHEWLHDVSDSQDHQCAVTLVSSGSVEHSVCASAAPEPNAAPPVPLSSAKQYPLVLAGLEFTRLEHAPPIFS